MAEKSKALRSENPSIPFAEVSKACGAQWALLEDRSKYVALARTDKKRRAAPVAALYAAGRVHHVGHFRELEDEMLEFGQSKASPNRLDAMVWGVSHLLIGVEPPQFRYL